MRPWANGGTHMNGQPDHSSTLSRPRSIEAISNGTLPNNLRACNGVNGINGINGIMSRGSGGLHEDLDFPTSTNTKSLSRRKPIVWMRPHVSFKSILSINCYNWINLSVWLMDYSYRYRICQRDHNFDYLWRILC